MSVTQLLCHQHVCYIKDEDHVANLSCSKDFISACELFILTNVDHKYHNQKLVAVDVSL